MKVFDGKGLDMPALLRATSRPDLHAPGESLFWDDPHIAAGMLEAHLDPEVDAASRTPVFVERSAHWLMEHMSLVPGDRVLDLGCGPGLYCERFALGGLEVVGVDLSENSLDHARVSARRRGLEVEYLRGDFREAEFGGKFDAAFCIFGEFAVFSPPEQVRLLGKIRDGLERGGYLALDVPTRAHFEPILGERSWTVSEGGFWSPDPYLLLSTSFDYPDAHRHLHQHVVVAADGTSKIYRIWSGYYTPSSISALIENAGFRVDTIRADIAGSPLEAGSEWLGIIAQRPWG